MHKIILGVALAVALVVPAYAAGRFAPTVGQKLAAGQIAADGRIIQGLDFQARHIGRGRYQIEFNPGIFQGCVNVLITPIVEGPLTYQVLPETRQYACGNPLFEVKLWVPGTTFTENHAFQFLAVEI